MPLSKKFSDDGKCTVKFTVSKEAAGGAKTISIAGDWNSWSSTTDVLKKGKNGDFSISIVLEKGKEYQFRYLLDGARWENDWAADKYIPAPFSSTDNSVVICLPEEKKLAVKKTSKK